MMLNKDELSKLLEVMAMTELIADMIEKRAVERVEEVARKMLKRGMSVNEVAEDTGLEESTIRELYAKLNVA